MARSDIRDQPRPGFRASLNPGYALLHWSATSHIWRGIGRAFFLKRWPVFEERLRWRRHRSWLISGSARVSMCPPTRRFERAQLANP